LKIPEIPAHILPDNLGDAKRSLSRLKAAATHFQGFQHLINPDKRSFSELARALEDGSVGVQGNDGIMDPLYCVLDDQFTDLRELQVENEKAIEQLRVIQNNGKEAYKGIEPPRSPLAVPDTWWENLSAEDKIVAGNLALEFKINLCAVHTTIAFVNMSLEKHEKAKAHSEHAYKFIDQVAESVRELPEDEDDKRKAIQNQLHEIRPLCLLRRATAYYKLALANTDQDTAHYIQSLYDDLTTIIDCYPHEKHWLRESWSDDVKDHLWNELGMPKVETNNAEGRKQTWKWSDSAKNGLLYQFYRIVLKAQHELE